MIPRDPSPRRRSVFFEATAALLLALALLAAAPPPARAVMTQVQAIPPNPTSCDSVTLVAGGTLSSPCYQVLGATISGPEPPNPLCMGPICPSRFDIHVFVKQPAPGTPCPAVVQPYTQSFQVGRLPPGAYSVVATEVLLPFGPDSTSFADSTSASLLFSVAKADTCIPGAGCVILGFAITAPMPPFCTAAAPPGGEACFNLFLSNTVPIGGLQTEIGIFDPLLDPQPGGGSPSPWFAPVSIGAVGRAVGLQAEWSTVGGVTKLMLYSTSGVTIPAGNGPVARLCYKVASEARSGSYRIVHQSDVVADSEGTALPFCPTFRETNGIFCVQSPACDLDGNGSSDIRDIIRLVHCAIGPVGGPECPDSIAARADCNGDGAIDVRDVICCVRRILQARVSATQSPLPAPLSADPEATIGFEGPVRWISPAEGSATLLLRSSSALGGAEWSVLTDPAHLRVRDLSLIGPAGYHLEWAARPGGGVAFAMLFAEGAVDPTQPVAIQLSLDRIAPSATATDVSLVGFQPVAPAGTPLAAGTTGDRLSVPPGGLAAPAVFPARPNPFAAETEIAYSLPAPARLTLRVFDVSGRLVRTLVNGPAAAGVGRVTWNGKDDFGRQARSGIYFVRLEAAGVERTARLLHLR